MFLIRLAIFLPYLFLLRSHVARCLSLSPRPVKPIPFHLRPFIFVLFYPAAFSVSSSLSLPSPLVSSILTSPCLVYFPLIFSSPRARFGPLTSSSPHLAGRAFAFDVHIFLFLLECRGSHAERSLPHLPFKPLIFFFFFVHSAKRHYRALRKVRKRDGAEWLRSRDRDK